MWTKTRLLKIQGLLTLGCLYLSLFAPVAGGSTTFIQGLEVSPQVFEPTRGEKARIAFQVAAPATATLKIFDPSHFHIITLKDNFALEPGRHTVYWDGRDADGSIVPDEAYYCSIDLTYADGRHVAFNPAYSGGEYLGIIPHQLHKDQGQLSFSLPEPARVRIRAGVNNGALYKTLLDWDPRSAGEHRVDWNGQDQSGSLSIWNKKDFVINTTAFALPPTSILVSKTGIDYLNYWTQRAAASGMSLFEYLRTSKPAREARLRAGEMAQQVLAKTGVAISQYYLMNRFSNRPPEVTLQILKNGNLLEADIPRLSGSFHMRINFSELTRQILLQQRYEIILYIDDVMVMEDESGYSPYTWPIDSSTLENGAHDLTVNIATLSDQVGTCTQRIIIDNPTTTN